MHFVSYTAIPVRCLRTSTNCEIQRKKFLSIADMLVAMRHEPAVLRENNWKLTATYLGFIPVNISLASLYSRGFFAPEMGRDIFSTFYHYKNPTSSVA